MKFTECPTCLSPRICRTWQRCREVASAGFASEKPPTQGVDAVATGSKGAPPMPDNYSLMRTTLQTVEQYIIDLREKAALIANNAPEEKERFVGRQMIILCEKALIASAAPSNHEVCRGSAAKTNHHE